MKQLRPYQTQAIDQLSQQYASGTKKMIFQLATGGGKSVTFAGLADRFLKAFPDKQVLIAVHREELLNQSRKTLYDWYGTSAYPIVAGVKRRPPNANVLVTMVETANNRLKKNPRFFGDVGLFIIDEAHLGNFTKLHAYFPDALIVGFTATPISSSKKFPLNGLYEDIVCGIDIPDLIAQGSLMPNKTYHIKGSVSRANLKVKNGEFDMEEMSKVFSSNKHIHNCVEAYEKHAIGTKTIVFNCNVEHSKLVTQAFREAGYQSRHLDGTAHESERSDTLKWFSETPNAILNNIGILTTGFDEPTVQTVIVNRATKSLPLWLQVTGRGSRPAPKKDHFTIIDLGGNAISHGDWSASRDWATIFHNPEMAKEGGGVAPVRECEQCEAIIPASTKICPFCHFEKVEDEQYDQAAIELELLNNAVDIAKVVEQTEQYGYNDYYALHIAKSKIAKAITPPITDTIAYKALEAYQLKVQEWCKAKGRKYNQWHKEKSAEWLMEELKRVHNWAPNAYELQITA